MKYGILHGKHQGFWVEPVGHRENQSTRLVQNLYRGDPSPPFHLGSRNALSSQNQQQMKGEVRGHVGKNRRVVGDGKNTAQTSSSNTILLVGIS